MWTNDDNDEPLWIDDPEPTTEKRVMAFFEKHRDDVVVSHDLGYGCSANVSVEQLYEMFRLRYELEKEGYEF